jgi:hypothetical protein
MNTNATDLRPLKLLVAILGLAIVVLSLLWWQRASSTGATSESTRPTATHAVADDRSDPSRDSVRDDAESTTQRSTTDEPARSEAAHTAPDTGLVVYGTVRDAAGALLRKGFLFAYADGKHTGTASLRDGTFTFSGLRRGELRLVSRIDDELPLNHRVTLTSPHTRLDLRLAPQWRVTVHALTPDGQPLRNQLAGGASPIGLGTRLGAFASHEPLTADLATGRHVAEHLGRFRGVEFMSQGSALPSSAVGVLTLPTDRPVHVTLVLGHARIATQHVAPGQSDVTFTLEVAAVRAKTGTVHLRVVDDAGAPVPTARVSIHDSSSGGGGAKVDADGRITIRDVPPGRLRLSVSASKAVAPPRLIEVAPGAEIDLGDVRVETPVVVGIEFPGITESTHVTVTSLGAPPRTPLFDGRARITVDAGKRENLMLAPGRHLLHARSRTGGVATVEIDTRALPPMPLRIPLARGVPVVFDVEVAGTHLQLLQGAGIVHEQTFEFAMPVTVEVQPGEYTVVIRPPNGPPSQQKLTVSPSGARLRVP